MRIRNTFIIFIVSGFWHGANWTFIIWGALNAVYFLPLLLTNRNRNNLEIVAQGKIFPTIKEVLQILVTFSLTLLAWVFFRADNVSHAFAYISEIFSSSLFSVPQFELKNDFIPFIWALCFFLIVEWMGREDQFAIEKFGLKWKRPLRWVFYYLIILSIYFLRGRQQEFIYFQF